jgi:RNA polymerase sigma-70 factor (ECF subfamily)
VERNEERALLLRIRQGEREAFGLLVERHLSRAVALATRILKHREDAEDLVQDAFLSALQHIDSFDIERPFWPWLARIILHRGLDLDAARSIRSAQSLTDELPDSRPSPADLAERNETLERFNRVLAGFPPRRRLVVQLFEVDGFSVAEIAKLLDTSAATVRWHLHVSRRQLRMALTNVVSNLPLPLRRRRARG